MIILTAQRVRIPITISAHILGGTTSQSILVDAITDNIITRKLTSAKIAQKVV